MNNPNKESTNNSLDTSSLQIDSPKIILDTTMKGFTNLKDKQKSSGYPIGTFKTYSQIVKSIFSYGSKTEEVLKVLGEPDLIDPDDSDPYGETWHYENTEIHFTYGIVDNAHGIYIHDKIKHFVDAMDLINSGDPIQQEFGRKLFNRQALLQNKKTFGNIGK